MLLYENNIARILLDRAVPCLVFEWKEGVYSRQDFRSVMARWLSGLYSLRTLVPNGQPLGVLVNNRHAHPIDVADQDWMAENITPRQLEAGLTFVAIVDGQTVTSHTNITNWRMRVDIGRHPFVTELFPDAASARAWLHEALSDDA